MDPTVTDVVAPGAEEPPLIEDDSDAEPEEDDG